MMNFWLLYRHSIFYAVIKSQDSWAWWTILNTIWWVISNDNRDISVISIIDSARTYSNKPAAPNPTVTEYNYL